MIVSHQHKYIFIKTYKTAGTSLEVLLSKSLGLDDVSTPFGVEHPEHVVRNHEGLWSPVREIMHGGRHDRAKCIRDLRKRRRFYNHIPARIARDRLPREVWDKYFKFCVERNPWDKIVSLFHMRKSEFDFDITLSEFIRRGYHCRNYPQYSDSSGQVVMDRVLRYESLDADLSDVLKTLEVPFDGALSIRAKAHFRTDRRSYQELLSDVDREIIAKSHADEIAAHGYCF